MKKEEYIIDFDCDVYLGKFIGGSSRKVAHVVGSAITDEDPDQEYGLDPNNIIPLKVLKYLGLEDNELNYVVIRLRSWGWLGPDRDSPIWIRTTWGNP